MDSDDLRLMVAVGRENWPPGYTHLTLWATGRVRVANRLLGRDQQAEAFIDPDEAARLFAPLLPLEGTDGPPAFQPDLPPPVPDEVCYEINLYRETTPVYTAAVWHNSVTRFPVLAALIADLRALVQQVSAGRFIL
jgi:hypothetical protein